MSKLQELIQNRKQIANGIWNYFFGSHKNKALAKERIEICRSNKCGMYDPKGQSAAAFFPGKESCGCCGCLLKTLTACEGCKCSLHEINKEPLW